MEDLAPKLDQLDRDLDALEAAAGPLLLGDQLATAAVRLPLLDKAKLHVLASYAMESTLFCGLGVAGVAAREHAVFRELQRVRQYMKKIEQVEAPKEDEEGGGGASTKPTSRLDKAAAIRFVKADMDDPVVKAKLGALAARAGAADEAAAAAAAARAARGRKRGSGPAAADRRDRDHSGSGLTKRPKHGGRDGSSRRPGSKPRS